MEHEHNLGESAQMADEDMSWTEQLPDDFSPALAAYRRAKKDAEKMATAEFGTTVEFDEDADDEMRKAATISPPVVEQSPQDALKERLERYLQPSVEKQIRTVRGGMRDNVQVEAVIEALRRQQRGR